MLNFIVRPTGRIVERERTGGSLGSKPASLLVVRREGRCGMRPGWEEGRSKRGHIR